MTANELLSVKQRFGIIGNTEALNNALEVAIRVAPTDLSVLVTGESGVGKEFFPQVIHAYSARKHNKYIPVNCGAIPEGTIDSELFGHEKGSFTGAIDSRKGYFEEADGGTIFLDEVGELPISTQVRLLRVLQTGEFMRVGSTKVQKTNVRVVAATNNDLLKAIAEGRFREDLYYRLNTVPIAVPSLRERKGDIYILFRKFASDVATQYRMPAITLDEGARALLESYHWRGNVRQLKNVAEQISAVEQSREISAEILRRYLPNESYATQHIMGGTQGDYNDMTTERELLYKILFDMRNDINELMLGFTLIISGINDISEKVANATSDAEVTALINSTPGSAIWIMKIAMMILPLICILTGFVIYWKKFKIDEQTYAGIVADLEARAQGVSDSEGNNVSVEAPENEV